MWLLCNVGDSVMAIVRRAATFNSNGTTLWSDGPGWSATLIGSGFYQVNFPVVFSSETSYAVMVTQGQITDAGMGLGPAKILAYWPTTTNIRIQTKIASSNDNAPFTIEVIGETA